MYKLVIPNEKDFHHIVNQIKFFNYQKNCHFDIPHHIEDIYVIEDKGEVYGVSDRSKEQFMLFGNLSNEDKEKIITSLKC